MGAEKGVSLYITIHDTKVHYIATGEPHDLNVLFLHGARFSAKDWLSVESLQLLAKNGYGAYALDLPGFGESERASLKSEILMEEFVKELGLGQFVLVGPSMGGQIALHCALKKLKGLVALVLFAPAGLPAFKDQLKQVEIPILLMWGDRDKVISPSNADILLREPKRTRLFLFRGEGHTGYFNRPQSFNKVLLNFLVDLKRGQKVS